MTRFPFHRFVCIARNAENLQLRGGLSRYVAAQWDSFPQLTTVACDVLNVDAMAECLGRHQPDLIFNATTPFPWWRIAELPSKAEKEAEAAGPGMWAALDSLLPLSLAQSMELADCGATYVNGCYPDLTNPFLRGLPRAPVLGIGNVSNLVPGFRLAFSRVLGVPTSRVEVRLVAHHYVSWNGPTPVGAGGAPYHLTVSGPDSQLVFEAPSQEPFRLLVEHASRTRGLAGLGVTIGSATTVLTALLDDVGGNVHCPGPFGLPGGYPVTIGADGRPWIDLAETITLDRATEINRAAQRFDGIDHVEPGLVVPTARSRDAFQHLTGLPLPDITFQNVYEIAQSALTQINSRYGLGLGGL